MNLPPTENFPLPYHPSWEILDSTKIQAYQSCPRMFFYEYILGWRPSRPSNHLVFGKAVHSAMEHLILNGYRVESVRNCMEIFNKEYRLTYPESTDELFTPKTPARFFDLIIEYIREYANDAQHYSVYKTEIGGTINLSPDHKMAYKMDTILYDNYTSKYCSLEHKTKGGNYISPNYPYEFMLNIQLGTYTHVLNSIFPPIDVSEVIINCLCLKKTKQPSFILKRFPIPLSNPQMLNWLENTKGWMDTIEADYKALSTTTHRSQRMNCFPLNGRACTNWGRVCHYHDLCTSWLNPLRHQDRMPTDMEVDFWNPLEEDLTERIDL